MKGIWLTKAPIDAWQAACALCSHERLHDGPLAALRCHICAALLSTAPHLLQSCAQALHLDSGSLQGDLRSLHLLPAAERQGELGWCQLSALTLHHLHSYVLGRLPAATEAS